MRVGPRTCSPGPAYGDRKWIGDGARLDRLTMLAKGIDDIRLLRSTDPRVAAQLADLEPYRPVGSTCGATGPVARSCRRSGPELLADQVRGCLAPMRR